MNSTLLKIWALVVEREREVLARMRDVSPHKLTHKLIWTHDMFTEGYGYTPLYGIHEILKMK